MPTPSSSTIQTLNQTSTASSGPSPASSAPLKLCAACLVPLAPSDGPVAVDPFVASLSDEPNPASLAAGVPVVCRRCASGERERMPERVDEPMGIEGEDGGPSRSGPPLMGAAGWGDQTTVWHRRGTVDGYVEEAEADEEIGSDVEMSTGRSTAEGSTINEQYHPEVEEQQQQQAMNDDAVLLSSSTPSSLLVEEHLPAEIASSPLSISSSPAVTDSVEAVSSTRLPATRTTATLLPEPAASPPPPSSSATAAPGHPPPASPLPDESLSYLPPRRPSIFDLTQCRVPSIGKDCIYPGSRFVGTQKSGRSSYDVSVTIVDVDYPNSTLSGYLKICGLTEDHPVLTTFFEGEIIGPRYGFLTKRWDATEQNDLNHWQRFPLFRPLKNMIRRTAGWTIPSCNIPAVTNTAGGSGGGGGGVSCAATRSKSPDGRIEPTPSRTSMGAGGGLFMRWKEKFLVPDHKTLTVSGASFAGFYYICVEFAPPPLEIPLLPGMATPKSPPPLSRALSSQRRLSGASLNTLSTQGAFLQQPIGSALPATILSTPPSSPPTPPSRRIRRGSSQIGSMSGGGEFGGGGAGGSGYATPLSTSSQQSSSSPTADEPAILSGFYFHSQNSEPFQELSLRHVRERERPVFEYC